MNCCVIVEPPCTTAWFWTSAHERAPDRPQVDAAVLVEALVLDGDDRLLHDRGDLLGLDDDPALAAAQHGQQLAPCGRRCSRPCAIFCWCVGVVLRDLAGDRRQHPKTNEANESKPSTAEEGEEAELADSAPRSWARR